MRQERDDCIFHHHPKCPALHRSSRKRLLKIGHQQLVQVGIRTRDCQIHDCPGEGKFVSSRCKINIAAKESCEFRGLLTAAGVDNSDTARPQMQSRELDGN